MTGVWHFNWFRTISLLLFFDQIFLFSNAYCNMHLPERSYYTRPKSPCRRRRQLYVEWGSFALTREEYHHLYELIHRRRSAACGIRGATRPGSAEGRDGEDKNNKEENIKSLKIKKKD